jgi:hypothetical protein
MAFMKVIQGNITNPSNWLLNLNPATAEKTSNTDFEAVLISWSMILIPLLLVVFLLFRRAF